jgi:uncharacterized protein (DUF362 family)
MISEPGIVYSKKVITNGDLFMVLEDLFDKMGGLVGRVSFGDKVLIKPNLVAPFENVTTDLRFIDFFIAKIRQVGAVPVIGESSGFEFDTEATFDILGVKSFAEDRNVKLINLEKEKYSRVYLDGFGPVEIANTAIEASLIINLPVLKGHNITKITGAVKNLFGFLSKPSRRHMHFHQLERGIAALARRFENTLHFVDARFLLTRAVFGERKPLGYCFAGLNPFTLDHFGARLFGVNPESVTYLKKTSVYSIEGDVPDEFPVLGDESSLRKRLHRIIYSIFYFLDEIKCSTLGGNSIIPSMHWYFGIHPEIGKVTLEELKHLSSLCQVGAISIEEGKIIKDKCIKVRCLKCYREAEHGKIFIKGFNRPKGRLRNE